MIRKLVFLFIALPVAIILILLSVANRQAVTLSLDPFNAAAPAVSLTWPFFVFLFAALLCGMIIGSVATWWSQGSHRRKEREFRTESVKWKSEAESQKKRAEELAGELNPGLGTTGLTNTGQKGQSGVSGRLPAV